MDIKTKLHVTNIFGNDLASVRKSEVTFTLSKVAYVGMCMLDLNKVFIYEFHYDYIKIKYGNNSVYQSLTLVVWCMKLKLEIFMKNLVRIKNAWFS